MEQSIESIREKFSLSKQDIRSYSPLTLAYLGDAVYEVVVRTILVERGNCQVNKLHKQASQLVKAHTQSEMMKVLEPVLTEEELAVYKRGRNAHSATTAKNASVGDYRRATGFEAVMGYLYLQENWNRMLELMKIAIEYKENNR